MTIPPVIQKIAQAIATTGGRSYLVGGAVRDSFLDIEAKDLDLEVFGLLTATLEETLRETMEHVIHVGKTFPVWKVWDGDSPEDAIDIALPRHITPEGTTRFNPSLSFQESAAHRDFTINAIGLDPITGDVEDPFNGRRDLDARILRHVSPTFGVDRIRVLRGAQLIARLNLTATPETVALCATIPYNDLQIERIAEEFKKLILKGKYPAKGLAFLRAVKWDALIPELKALQGVPQDPTWHPEGDVWTHTLHCMDAFANHKIKDDTEDYIIGLAVLCHDLGKPTTTVKNAVGRWISPGHESLGAVPTKALLARITNETEIVKDVVALVVEHMTPVQLYKQAPHEERPLAMSNAIRRLSRRVRIDRLIRVCKADKAGRPPLPPDDYASEWLFQRATEMKIFNRPPPRILMGKHLIELGFQPGPSFSDLLNEVYELQLDGQIHDLTEAIAHIQTKHQGAGI